MLASAERIVEMGDDAMVPVEKGVAPVEFFHLKLHILSQLQIERELRDPALLAPASDRFLRMVAEESRCNCGGSNGNHYLPCTPVGPRFDRR